MAKGGPWTLPAVIAARHAQFTMSERSTASSSLSTEHPRDRLVELTREECLIRLGRGGVGRVAVSVGALPAILPVNYAMVDGDVVFCTGAGTKLEAALTSAVVAFEVDDTESMSHCGWSVLVVGVAHIVEDPSTLVRDGKAPALSPWAGGDRDRFVRIETAVITGRQLADRTGGDGD